MALSDPLEILLAHDAWATNQIIDACEKLTPEEFAMAFDIGPGSLRKTITHIIGAMQGWIDTLEQRPLGSRIDQDGRSYSVTELRRLLSEAGMELARQARRLPIDATVKRTRNGREFTFTRGIVLTHVTTHAMHHRAQCLNMLRRLGLKQMPLSSVVEWSWSTDTAAQPQATQ